MGEILCINLVRGKNNDHEVMLKNRFEDMVARVALPYISYKFFDFHNECHENSQPFIDLVDNFIFPKNCASSGLFCKTFRLVTENCQSRVIDQV